MFILMIIANTQYYLLLKRKQRTKFDDPVLPLSIQYQYSLLILYLLFNCFTFISINNVLCYYLTRFLLAKIQYFIAFFNLHNIYFWDHYKTILEETFGVIFI